MAILLRIVIMAIIITIVWTSAHWSVGLIAFALSIDIFFLYFIAETHKAHILKMSKIILCQNEKINEILLGSLKGEIKK